MASVQSWNGCTYIRPKYPYQKWIRQSETDHTTLTAVDKLQCSEDERQSDDSSDSYTPNFGKFILECVNFGEARYPIFREGDQIRDFVEEKVSQLRQFLHNSFKMFQDCQILKQGSVYEGTKIQKPDEFDFMIEVPAITSQSAIEIFLYPVDDESAGLAGINIINNEFFKDICTHPASRYDPVTDGYSKKCDLTFGLKFERVLIVKILLIYVSRIIRYKLNELMPENSKYEGLYFQPDVEKAMTFSLLWQGKEFPWLPISIDFVIGIPLQTNVSGDGPIHAVFYSHSCRISFSCLETRHLRRYPIDNGRKKLMRLMKLFKEKYLTKFSTIHRYEDHITKTENPISTYLIKNIVFYLYTIYEDSQDKFSDSELPNRVVEAFNILLQCCQRCTLHSFYLPAYNLMSFDDQDDDGRKEKVLRLKTVILDIGALLNAIRNMETNPRALNELQQRCEEESRLNNTEIDQAIFERFIKELLDYARNGYRADGLKRLKANCVYLNDFHDCDYALDGEGENISFTVKGKKIDIIEEILTRQKEFDKIT